MLGCGRSKRSKERMGVNCFVICDSLCKCGSHGVRSRESGQVILPSGSEESGDGEGLQAMRLCRLEVEVRCRDLPNREVAESPECLQYSVREGPPKLRGSENEQGMSDPPVQRAACPPDHLKEGMHTELAQSQRPFRPTVVVTFGPNLHL